ncbi:MarR family winged helix-turn-helix transcriptional regulator [Sorangium sp. So ce394]|uniref:MarR family winged helix-turn-helix transcriptional regulator n=1 Tax=Sorangium sp. So ce394 TaxID=3133310 RepID=UPI003F5C535A
MSFQIDRSLGFLLNRAASTMRLALEDRLRPYDLTAPQWAVLERLAEDEGQTMSSLGQSLGFDRPTTTGVVKRLELKGLVERTADASDGRVVRLALSERGRAQVSELPPLAAEVNRKAARGLSRDERAALERLLLRVIANMKG